MYIFVIFGGSLNLYIWKNSNLQKHNLRKSKRDRDFGAEIVIV